MQNPLFFTTQSPPKRLQNGPKTGPEFDEIMKNEWFLPVKVDFALFVFFNMFFLPFGALFGDLHFGMVFTVLRALGSPRGPQRDPPKEHVSDPRGDDVRKRAP